jgi:hypothetical protein
LPGALIVQQQQQQPLMQQPQQQPAAGMLMSHSAPVRGAMPTIPGGDTPLASLTAEDAAAFLALSAAQRERAGQLSQEELDASIQRALQKGEFDDRLVAGEGTTSVFGGSGQPSSPAVVPEGEEGAEEGENSPESGK